MKCLARAAGDRLVALAYPGAHSRISNHIDLFSPAIRGLGSEQQRKEWEGTLSQFGVIGCFCMTELGHGSFARGIETTATFDQEKDCFFINSPNVTSAKVWIGSAGKTATHAVVYAQLIVDKKNHGLNAFIVQLRDRHSGCTLPGITCGDMGAKMGRNALDNGIVWFSNVQVPRASLLSRYTQVSATGEVSVSPLQQLSFLALVGGRIMMVHASYGYLSMAATIATRYLACRRQFPSRKQALLNETADHRAGNAPVKTTSQANAPAATGAGEVVVLDYPVQSRKLAGSIATALAMHAAGWQLEKLHANTKEALAAASKSPDGFSAALVQLKSLHNVSAALKAESTWSAYEAIDTCRQACGGVGYSAYSALPGLQADFAVLPTWEGDNTLMCMQTGGFILKALKSASAGGPVPAVLGWLPAALQTAKPFEETVGASTTTVDGLQGVLSSCLHALHWSVAQRALSIGGALASGESTTDQAAEGLVAMARTFAAAYVINAFSLFAVDPIEHGAGAFWRKFRRERGILRQAEAEDSPATAEATRLLLHRFAALYALNSVISMADGFVGGCSGDVWAELHRTRDTVADQLRGDLVATCDSFGHSDFVLGSAVGNFDGSVYESYLSAIRSAPGFSQPQSSPNWQQSFGQLFAASRSPPGGDAKL